MRDFFKIAMWVLLGIGVMFVVSLVTGYSISLYNLTAGKAIKNSERVVFENTQSYVRGKRLEASKLYKEYRQAETPEDREIINNIIRQSFADFDEEKYLEEPLRTFIYDAKYYSYYTE